MGVSSRKRADCVPGQTTTVIFRVVGPLRAEALTPPLTLSQRYDFTIFTLTVNPTKPSRSAHTHTHTPPRTHTPTPPPEPKAPLTLVWSCDFFRRAYDSAYYSNHSKNIFQFFVSHPLALWCWSRKIFSKFSETPLFFLLRASQDFHRSLVFGWCIGAIG